jgi:hypothetical protein
VVSNLLVFKNELKTNVQSEAFNIQRFELVTERLVLRDNSLIKEFFAPPRKKSTCAAQRALRMIVQGEVVNIQSFKKHQ